MRIWKPLQIPSTRPPLAGELGDRLHDRREARDRAAAEVVAVGEPAGEDDGCRAGGKLRARRARPAGRRRRGASRASSASRSSFEPGKTTTAIRGRALRRRHSRGVQLDLVALDQRVREQLLAHPLDLGARLGLVVGRRARARRAGRPCASPTSKPRCRRLLSTACPCGSRMPLFGRTRTVAFTPSTDAGSAR